MTSPRLITVILAAGQGTRMKSDLPKVLHRIAHRPMIEHVLAASAPLKPERQIVVIGPGMEGVAKAVAPAETVIQKTPRGTGDAVKAAARVIEEFEGDVLVLYGDAPLVTSATLERLLAARAEGAAVAVLGMRPKDVTPYGRLVEAPDGRLIKIVESLDCTPDEAKIGLCNSGIMAIDGRHLSALLNALGTGNRKGEYYLTDIIEIAHAQGLACRAVEAPDEELVGVNSRAELARAESLLQTRLRHAAMASGVTLVAPETVFLSADTTIGRDSVVGPFVVFGPNVTVGERVEIPAFCHLVGATIGDGASIGPFARLRPGADLGENVHIGNFVEVKNSRLEAGVKANHLTYLGDSKVGPGSNIGAGTITCNYDGIEKFRTEIGAEVFVGSHATLVAPLAIGNGAFIAAGSVITADVPDDAMALGRARQSNKTKLAAAWRARRRAEKSAKANQDKR